MTRKSCICFRTSKKQYEKIKVIAKEYKTTITIVMIYMVTKFLEKYEEAHGEILISDEVMNKW